MKIQIWDAYRKEMFFPKTLIVNEQTGDVTGFTGSYGDEIQRFGTFTEKTSYGGEQFIHYELMTDNS